MTFTTKDPAAPPEGAVFDLDLHMIRAAMDRLRAADVTEVDSLGAGRGSELEPLRFGPSLELCAELDSTMDVLAASAREGAPAGSVVIADFQRTGRGRLKRAWLAPPGTALMLSMLFRPDPMRLPPERMHELSMAVGLAAHDAIRSYLPVDARAHLKWPNDLLVGGEKIAGLLAEASWDPNIDAKRGTVIVGIGINVRQREQDLPEGATSLAEALSKSTPPVPPELRGSAPHRTKPTAERAGELGRDDDVALDLERLDPLHRSHLAARLLVGVEKWVARLNSGASLVPVWSERLDTLGKRVVARRSDERLEGIAEGVDEDGALRIRLEDGRLERLHAGDVTLARQ